MTRSCPCAGVHGSPCGAGAAAACGTQSWHGYVAAAASRPTRTIRSRSTRTRAWKPGRMSSAGRRSTTGTTSDFYNEGPAARIEATVRLVCEYQAFAGHEGILRWQTYGRPKQKKRPRYVMQDFEEP